METKKLIIVILLIFFLWNETDAQVSGFQGRRLVVKTDLSTALIEKGYFVGVEAALMRRLSLEVSYRTVNRQLRQPVNAESNFSEALGITVSSTGKYGNLLDDRASFSGKEFSVMMKLYFRSAFCAPKGRYLKIYFAPGRADIMGESAYFQTDSISGIDDYTLQAYELGNVRTIRYGIGFGNQWMLADRFSIDLGVSLDINVLDAKEFSTIINGLEVAYGSPILSQALYRVKKSKPTYGGASHISNWGVAADLKLGILLF